MSPIVTTSYRVTVTDSQSNQDTSDPFEIAILEGDPYPLRAMIVSGSSIITSWPNPALWRSADGTPIACQGCW